MPLIEAILLAAGESRRMGYPKPLLQIGGQTFVEHLSYAMLTAVPRLIVVVGAHSERVRPAIPRDPRIVVVENPNYARGQLSSIKAGLARVSLDAAAAMIHLCDHPTVKAQTFAALPDQYVKSQKPVVIARFRGHRGHPVLFDRSIFAELMRAPEDQGARVVVDADLSRVSYVEVDDPGVVLDLDTPEDLTRAGLTRPPGP